MTGSAKWLLCLIGCVIGLSVGFPWIANPAQAQVTDVVTLRVHAGFQDYYDPRVWVPVRVTLIDSQHHSWQGKLVCVLPSPVEGGGPYEGSLQWPVHSNRVGEAHLTIGLPGALLQQGARLQLVVAGEIMGKAKVVAVPEQGPDLAGVVSNNPATVQFLAGVSSANGTSELVTAYVPPDGIPDSAELLQSLTYLYIDGATASELTVKQVSTIFSWVRMGGILILGGMQPNAGQVGSFVAVSPISGHIIFDRPGDSLASFAGTAPPRGNLPELFGPADRQSHVLIGTRKEALLAVRFMGRGEVATVGLNPSSTELISWAGNAMLWDAVLHALHSSVLSSKPDLFGVSGLWGLMNAAEQFPQLHSPPLWIWELVFVLYIFTCGPLLFFVLRRRHKNEWAWILLPSVSVTLALAIYELGVLQRPNGILTQTVGMIDIVDENLAQGVGVEALMSPQTRSYTVTMPNYSWLVPMAERASELANTVHSDQVNYLPNGNLVQFQDVGAWGGRFVYGVHVFHHFGRITGELFRAGKSLGGYLLNDTTTNFSDVALIVDGQVLRLGPLARGKDVLVQWAARSDKRVAPLAVQLATALPSASHGVGHALFDYVSSYAVTPAPAGTVLLIAWSHHEPRMFRTQGPELPAVPQWMVREVIPVTPIVE